MRSSKPPWGWDQNLGDRRWLGNLGDRSVGRFCRVSVFAESNLGRGTRRQTRRDFQSRGGASAVFCSRDWRGISPARLADREHGHRLASESSRRGDAERAVAVGLRECRGTSSLVAALLFAMIYRLSAGRAVEMERGDCRCSGHGGSFYGRQICDWDLPRARRHRERVRSRRVFRRPAISGSIIPP